MKKTDCIVIGAGAAGMMCAGKLAERGKSVLVIERNERVGRKLMITGKGRCNVTNACSMLNELIEAVPTNGRFLYSAFSRFMPSDTMDFFEELGVPLKVERGNRVFPVSDKAVDIVDALGGFMKKSGVKRIAGRVKEFIFNENNETPLITGVRTYEGEEFFASSFVVATGGVSYPLTGSTGDGYELAKQAGHTVTQPQASLVPLETAESFCAELQGLALKNVSLKLRDKDGFADIYEDFGEMLFTHFGVSGPVILSASAHMRDADKTKYEIVIDLKPGLSVTQLDSRIQRDIAKYSNKAAVNAFNELLPRAMIPVILDLCGIPHEMKANQLTREMRAEFVMCLKELKLNVRAFRPIEEAIITCGGVSVGEIEPKTMRSKKCANLFFAGEVIDVNAYTGGFNLQIAFSTGFIAGENALF